MATASPAYRNSGDLKSANYAPPPPSPLVRRIDASHLPPRLRETLKHFIIESQHGPDLWASTFRASKAAAVSYKTMQRHLDWLEREKILHKKHDANEFISGKGLRRPATYVLNGTSAKWLAPRETYPQWQRRNRRLAPLRKRPQRPASHNLPSNEGAKQEVEAVKPAPVAALQPVPPRQAVATRGDERTQKRRQAIVGSIRHFASKGYAENEAIRSACVACGLARELVDVELKAINFDFERDSAPIGLKGCAKHPESGLTQWGTCWACYSAEHSGERENTGEQSKGP